MIRIFLLLFFFPLTPLFCSSADYKPNRYISEKVWAQVDPYLLPIDHPAKPQLDAIFKKCRAIFNTQTMKKAGFSNWTPRKYTHIIVTKHPDLPGIIIKTFLDVQRHYHQKEYDNWIQRAQGIEKIREIITEKGWENDFKLPNKWIYPLPENPSPPKEFARKNFILVEDDMEILSTEENDAMWGSPVVTKELLDKVFYIVDTLGLSDCAKPDNIPFRKDGQITFIDTQTFYDWLVEWDKMTPYLSEPMREYWKKLTKSK